MIRICGFSPGQIAAVSGASALFGYQPGEWMPKYAHLQVNPDQRIAEATGLPVQWTEKDYNWKVTLPGTRPKRSSAARMTPESSNF